MCAMCRAGISLAMVARAYGCRCFIALPDDAAAEKAQLLQALGVPSKPLTFFCLLLWCSYLNVCLCCMSMTNNRPFG